MCIRDSTVIANAGGVNPVACAREVVRLAPGLKVAVVLGDDVYGRIDEFLAKGYELRDMDTGEPIAAIRGRILSANAYIGAFPLVEALATGAQVVIAGRLSLIHISVSYTHLARCQGSLRTNVAYQKKPLCRRGL